LNHRRHHILRYPLPIRAVILILFFCFCTYSYVSGQEVEEQDSTFVEIEPVDPEAESAEIDSLTRYQEVYPLDIGSDRGLFILSPDRMMQMRILGSVRVLMNYGDQAMPGRLTFNPYEIPLIERSNTPNFYANLSLTRLGFEVIRRTRKMGDLFIRIETDFAGKNGYRIRHAYGQLGRLLIGQTWTLFTNGNYVPATVSRDGIVGSSVFFTPQIRYTKVINDKINWQASIEYTSPEIAIPDSIDARVVQVIPDVVGRLNYIGEKLSFRIAGLVTTISGTDTSNTVSYAFGGGASFSGIYDVSSKDKIHLSVTSTFSASRFLDTFSGKNEDVAYDPDTQTFKGLISSAAFIAWSRIWPKNISSSLSTGVSAITNRGFQAGDEFSHSYATLINVFWQPVGGARLGIEYANGNRWNVNGEKGRANRWSILMYYDF
jgi:hypothetical protein